MAVNNLLHPISQPRHRTCTALLYIFQVMLG